MALSRLLLLAILQLLSISGVLAWKHASTEEFEAVVTGKDMVLIAFVAPNSEASQKFEPQWESVSSTHPQNTLSIDCTTSPEICTKYDIKSFPTIRLSYNSTMKRYRGPRTDIEMHLFLKRSARPSLTKLEEKDLMPFQASDNIVFIAYLPPSSPISTTFAKLADKHASKYTFGLLESEDLPTGKDGNVLSSIVAYKREEGEFGAFKGEDGDMRGLDAQLEKWVDEVSKPLIGEFNRKSEMAYLKGGKSLIYIFLPNEERYAQDRLQFRQLFHSLAKDYAHFITFLTVSPEYAHMRAQLGLSSSTAYASSPALAVYNPRVQEAFPFNQKRKIGPENVAKFVESIAAGKSPPYTGGDGKEIEWEDVVEEEEDMKKAYEEGLREKYKEEIRKKAAKDEL